MIVSQLSIGYLLANAVKALVRRTSDRFEREEVPITIHHHYLMNVLSSREEMIQSELASLMERDKSAVLRHIDQLEQMQLITREPNTIDRRKKHLVLTPKGQQLLEHTRRLIHETLDEMLTGVPKEDVEKFREVLIHLQGNDLC
ncbi:MAG: MarR family transcriptional regulator [Bacteroidia bacterium]